MEGTPARAVARAFTWTESTPKSLVKNAGAGRARVTVMRSFGATLRPNVIVAVPPPFLTAYSWASAVASLVPTIELLGACERSRVGCCLGGAIGPVPRADVEHEPGRADDHDHEDGREDDDLAVRAVEVRPGAQGSS